MSAKIIKTKDGTVRNKANRLDKLTLFDYINYTIMGLLIFITLYPVWYVLCVSFSSVAAINSGTVHFWPKGFNFDAYKQILETPRIPRAYWNSILYTAVGTISSVAMTTLYAYPLSRKRFVFRPFLIVMFVITMFFGGGMIPAFLLIRSLGMLDSMWALVVPGLIATFDLVVVKSFFEGLPEEMYEAAVIDGASEFRILLQIFVPLAKPAIASIALFFAMGKWNSYLGPSIYLSTAEKMPLQVILKDMLMDMTGTNPNNLEETVKTTPEGLKNATIFISVLPFLVVYPFLQKYFVKGLTIGAIKG